MKRIVFERFTGGDDAIAYAIYRLVYSYDFYIYYYAATTVAKIVYIFPNGVSYNKRCSLRVILWKEKKREEMEGNRRKCTLKD